MIRLIFTFLCLVVTLGQTSAAPDAVVTFNEIHFHPSVAQTSGEWVEFRNQNDVDVDVSGWRLDDGVDFSFPAGTVIKGGGYLLVAADPSAFGNSSGKTVIGPFRGSLSNSGEHVSLKNKNGRMMDEITWSDRQPWPVAADGSGATLSKVDELRESGTPANWAFSLQLGGTPGEYNFTSSATVVAPAVSQLGVARYLSFDNTTGESSGNNVAISAVGSPPYSTDVPSQLSGSSIDLNGTNQVLQWTDAWHPTAYTISAWVKADQIRNQTIILRTASSPTTSWSHQLRLTSAGKLEHYIFDGATKSVSGTTTVSPGQWYHVAGVAANGALARLYVNGVEEGTPVSVGTLWNGGTRWLVGAVSGGFSAWDGKLDDLGLWFVAQSPSFIAQLAAGSRSPLAPLPSNQALGKSVIYGTGAYPNTATGFNGGQFPAQRVTDGSVTDVFGVNYWLGRDGVANEHFILDLEQPVNIATILLRNTHNTQYNDRGIATFRLIGGNTYNSTSKTITDGTTLLTGSLSNVNSASVIQANAFTAQNGLAPSTVRYLKFEALTALSTNNNVGLNELEVYSDTVPPPTPGGPITRPTRINLSINEVSSAVATPFWLELHNYGTTSLNLTGYVLAGEAGGQFIFPTGSTIPAGGYLVSDSDAWGFTPTDGELLSLYSTSMTQIVDAVVVKNRHQARPVNLPTADFLYPHVSADHTPGAVNQTSLNRDVVINEIMYHHRPQYRDGSTPYIENPEEWIELTHRGSTSVDLTGWSLDGAVRFTFPAGSTLNSGDFLLLAKDPTAFTSNHPGLSALGPWNGSLSNRGDRIQLLDPLGNIVDEVFYRDHKPWPSFTDAGGSSLELINPHSDNSLPESWRASDETVRSSWQNYSFTAPAVTPVYNPNIYNFHELRLGLLDEGEVLIDDVSVVEDPTGTNRELIQNGSFTSGNASSWRLRGNHSFSTVVTEAGNPVLKLMTDGPQFYLDNHLETSLKSAGSLVPVVAGRNYRVSFRAKWLRGSPKLHAELYYNKWANVFTLQQPSQSGTPGAQNSTYLSNEGPSIGEVIHSPAVPTSSQPITVRAKIADRHGLGATQLKYSVGGASWQTVTMTLNGSIHTGTIPTQASGSVIQFYVQASDAFSPAATSTYPLDGVNSRALIKVLDGSAPSPSKQNLRVIMTAADLALLANSNDQMSNRLRGCTLIHNEREIHYDGSLRLRGSMFSRSDFSNAGRSIHFPADKPFRGTHRTISVRRSGRSEIVVKHLINAAGGIPDNFNDIIYLIGERSDILGPARMEMARFSSGYLDEEFPDGSRGTMFKMEGIREPQSTIDGNPESAKAPFPVGWVSTFDLANLGGREQYRHNLRALSNYNQDDNDRLITMCQTFSLTGQTFETEINKVIDVDQWLRCYAMMSLCGIGDVYTRDNPHNLNFYMPPGPSAKVIVTPWDWNFTFNRPTNDSLYGGANLGKLFQRPIYLRTYYGHLRDLIRTVYNTGYMNNWLNHYSTCSGETYGYGQYMTDRASFVTTQINSGIPPIAFSITTNSGNNLTTASSLVTLSGKGWIDVREIKINDSPESLPITWSSVNDWSITVPLSEGANPLTLTAYNHQGETVGSDSIIVTSTATIQAASAANCVISKLHYNPQDPLGLEFIEIMNISPTHRINLTGCAFTSGIDYAFPANSLLDPGARLVIYQSQFLNDTALSNGGERITLEAPGGVIIKDFAYDDASPWPASPDGQGPSLVLIAPQTNPDHSLAENWRSSINAGGSPGLDEAIHFSGDPLADDDADGWSNLIEYALGQNPSLNWSPNTALPTITIPRVPNADDAQIIAEVSTGLDQWSTALLVSESPTTQTYTLPSDLSSPNRVYFRIRVRER